MKQALLILLLLLSVGAVVGQPNKLSTARPDELLRERRYAAAFYNVENLYDTLRSDFYDDRDYTPCGRYGWNTERYNAKLKAVARVINDLPVDFIGLAEVENQAVVRDLAAALKEDYCYIHRTTSDRRGIDVALLYMGDRFVPTKIEQIPLGSSRELLHVAALWWDEPFDILVWHAPSKLNSSRRRSSALERLRAAADSLVGRGGRVMILGDLNADTDDAELVEHFGDGAYSLPVDRACRMGGSYMSGGEWQLLDHVVVDSATAKFFEPVEAGVFVRSYMLVPAEKASRSALEGAPMRTFDGRSYLGGASDHLPVFVFWSL